MSLQEIEVGQIVHSKAGRDKDRYFIIVGVINNDYVLISDGDVRKVEKPKKKKIKHLVFHKISADVIKDKIMAGMRINNGEVRNFLKSIGLSNQFNYKEV